MRLVLDCLANIVIAKKWKIQKINKYYLLSKEKDKPERNNCSDRRM